ncbi:MAG: hypothetical protein Q3959_01730 [Limosilactobacillus sp.]|uniref:hypothetical protein n=1 Tax=Limosilactobacillus sp. TaxID=2773925 RepID=UPI0026F4D3F2|nr:hypothetical protein [Limosilactobacillus sp.]
MQELRGQSLLKATPKFINKMMDQLFTEDVRPDHPRVDLLNPQPVEQRNLFIAMAIANQYKVTMQVTPINGSGYAENVSGYLRKINDEIFKLTNNNVSHIFRYNQIRYIAHI